MTALPEVKFPGTAVQSATVEDSISWVTVCRLEQLTRERGVAALVGELQIALFRLWDDEVLAVGNHDPFSGSNVISRGIVGTRGDTPTVASPMYKQVFDLRTGICLDLPETRLPTYSVRVVDAVVQVARGDRGQPVS